MGGDHALNGAQCARPFRGIFRQQLWNGIHRPLLIEPQQQRLVAKRLLELRLASRAARRLRIVQFLDDGVASLIGAALCIQDIGNGAQRRLDRAARFELGFQLVALLRLVFFARHVADRTPFRFGTFRVEADQACTSGDP